MKKKAQIAFDDFKIKQISKKEQPQLKGGNGDEAPPIVIEEEIIN